MPEKLPFMAPFFPCPPGSPLADGIKHLAQLSRIVQQWRDGENGHALALGQLEPLKGLLPNVDGLLRDGIGLGRGGSPNPLVPPDFSPYRMPWPLRHVRLPASPYSLLSLRQPFRVFSPGRRRIAERARFLQLRLPP